MQSMKWWAIAIGVFAVAGTTLGHHAMEYIEMESYSTARKGEFVFHLHYDYYVDDEDLPNLDHWELTPGISYGILNRLMFDIHTHFARFGLDHIVDKRREEFEPDGPSPFMEAAAATLQYRLVEDWLVDVAVVGSIEIPFGRSEDMLGSRDNVYEGLLIVGRDFEGHRNVTLNLGYEVEGDQDASTWALGAKTPISADPHGIAAGLEFLGSFDKTSDNWSLLPGVYLPLGAPNVVLKTGLEFGKFDGATGQRANVTLMYRF